MDWSLAFSIVFVGLSVVFVTLIALALIIDLIGKAFDRAAARRKPSQKQETPSPAPVQTAAPSEAVPVPAPPSSDEEEEVVAAILAAVAAMGAEEGKTYAVRSIRPAGSTRSRWAQSGILQNTTPF